MAHSRTGRLAGRLHEGRGIVSCLDHIEVVPGGFPYQTSEQIELAASGGAKGQGMAVARKRRRGGRGGRDDARFVEDVWWEEVQAPDGPWVSRTFRALLGIRWP